jgi:hypothetical protein
MPRGHRPYRSESCSVVEKNVMNLGLVMAPQGQFLLEHGGAVPRV